MLGRKVGGQVVPLAHRFWPKVKVTAGCWLWQGSLHKKGYGHTSLYGQNATVHAHRAAWLLCNGPIPDGLWVLHKCDNPPCVNPDHLFLGNNDDNVADRVKKGRTNPRRGEQNHRAKLTQAQVDETRILLATGQLNQSAIAAKYGVHKNTIWWIAQGRNWRQPDDATRAAIRELVTTC